MSPANLCDAFGPSRPEKWSVRRLAATTSTGHRFLPCHRLADSLSIDDSWTTLDGSTCGVHPTQQLRFILVLMYLCDARPSMVAASLSGASRRLHRHDESLIMKPIAMAKAGSRPVRTVRAGDDDGTRGTD